MILKKLPLITLGISMLSPTTTNARVGGVGIDDFRVVYGGKMAISNDEGGGITDVFTTRKGQDSFFIRLQEDTGGFLKIGSAQVLLFSGGIKGGLDVTLSLALGGVIPEPYENYFDFYVTGSYNLLQFLAEQQYHGTFSFNLGMGPVYIGYTYFAIDDVYNWDMETESYHYVAGAVSYYSIGVNIPFFQK